MEYSLFINMMSEFQFMVYVLEIEAPFSDLYCTFIGISTYCVLVHLISFVHPLPVSMHFATAQHFLTRRQINAVNRRYS